MEKKLIKKLIDELNQLRVNVYDFQKVVDIFQKNDYDEIYQKLDIWNIIHKFGIVDYEIVEILSKENDLLTNIYFLNGIEYAPEEYFLIDAYGHARNINNDDIKSCIDNIVSTLEYELK